MPSSSEVAAIAAWVSWSIRRLEKRSATRPAYAENSRIGRNCRPVAMPSATALSAAPCVRVRTSQSCATRCIQVPVLETTPPAA